MAHLFALVWLLVLVWTGAWADAAERRLDDLNTWSKVVFKPNCEAVLAAEIGGIVTEVGPDFGDSFDEGDILVRLDTTVHDVAVEQAKAALQAAKAKLAYESSVEEKGLRVDRAEAVVDAAKARLEAKESLRRDNNASKMEVEEARRDYVVAVIDLEQARVSEAPRLFEAQRDVAQATGKLRIARRNLDACTITAPFGGRALAVAVNEHELVRKGDPLLHLVDDRILIASFLLPEEAFHTVKIGQDVTVELDKQGEASVTARIAQVAATVEPGSRTFEVRAEVENSHGRLRSGMGGRVPLAQFGSGPAE
jgi:multidrug resistance efflux pump